MKKGKKYTLMLVDNVGTGEVTNVSVTSRAIRIFVVCMVIVAIVFLVGVYSISNSFYKEIRISKMKKEKKDLQIRISEYNNQLEYIYNELSEIDEMKSKISNLLSMQDKTIPKKLQINSNIDLSIKYNKIIDIDEERFFKKLENKISFYGNKVEEGKVELEELTNKLVENNIILASIPTIWPVSKGRISDRFGYRVDPINSAISFHAGIDIGSPRGGKVYASAKGVVVNARRRLGYGNFISIDHGYGFVTRYGHNAKLLVKEGERVEKGQAIAIIGSTGRSTGKHLHYEVLINGINVDPIKFLITNVN